MLLDEIIKRILDLTVEQQKEVMEYLEAMQQGQERRYSRLSARLKIDAVVDEDKLIQSDIRDISASGVFMNTDLKFELGKNARVVVSIPGHEKPVKLYGEITRIEEGGMAIRFEKMSPYFEKVLDDAIWKDRDRSGVLWPKNKREKKV
ncbi:PilZ domain-containing protein [Desulfobacula sp.]|uniref:PilZ domain-containing protein n=1 Tax=Desulfobacula sp. TaxID=2593537 RepID=UPI0026182F12|nr:PilZ domain-containing protein [Desulfobacula sp.]